MQKVRIILIRKVEKKETQVQLCELYVGELPAVNDFLVFERCRYRVRHLDYVVGKDDNVDCLVVYVFVRDVSKFEGSGELPVPAIFESV